MNLKLLLDTHIFLWWMDGYEIKTTGIDSVYVDELIEDKHNEVYISTISAWEITMLEAKGKIVLNEKNLDHVVQRYGFKWLATEWRHARHLPNIIPPRNISDANNDPADHWLVAQTLGDKLTLVTADGKIIRDFSRSIPILQVSHQG